MILDPVQSREARKSLGLSQAAVAKACGLGRPYLSEWENETRILADAVQQRLRDYFEEEGYQFPDDEAEEAPGEPLDASAGRADASKHGGAGSPERARGGAGCRVVDGWPVARGLRDGVVENILEEMARIDSLISDWLADPAQVRPGVREGLFWSEPDETPVELQRAQAEVVAGLMARHSLLARRLRGDTTEGLERVVLTTGRVIDADKVDDSEPMTNADALSLFLEESDTDPADVELEGEPA